MSNVATPYRQYDADKNVQEFYREHRANQTHEHSLKWRGKCGQGLGWNASVSKLFELSDKLVDPSDPDTELSQLHHALQTAEAARSKFPGQEYEWFHFTAFIHDLGKGILAEEKLDLW